MPRLAERQATLRQQAEALALKLRRHRVPGGNLETSIHAMSQLEQSARKSDGLGVRMRDEIRLGLEDGVPKGYEEMVGQYFRALAEGRTK
jgi:hypothetical protein